MSQDSFSTRLARQACPCFGDATGLAVVAPGCGEHHREDTKVPSKWRGDVFWGSSLVMGKSQHLQGKAGCTPEFNPHG